MSDVDKSGWGVWWVDKPGRMLWVGPKPEADGRVKYQGSIIRDISIRCERCWPEVVEALGDRAYCLNEATGRVDATASVWIAAARRPGYLPGAVLPAKGDATAAEYQAAGRAVRATREAEEERTEAARAMREMVERSPGWDTEKEEEPHRVWRLRGTGHHLWIGPASVAPTGAGSSPKEARTQEVPTWQAGLLADLLGAAEVRVSESREVTYVTAAESAWLAAAAGRVGKALEVVEALKEERPLGPNVQYTFNKAQLDRAMTAGWEPWAVPLAEWLVRRAEEAADTTRRLLGATSPLGLYRIGDTLVEAPSMEAAWDRVSPGPETRTVEVRAPAPMVAGWVPERVVREWLGGRVGLDAGVGDLARDASYLADSLVSASHLPESLGEARALAAEALLLVDRLSGAPRPPRGIADIFDEMRKGGHLDGVDPLAGEDLVAGVLPRSTVMEWLGDEAEESLRASSHVLVERLEATMVALDTPLGVDRGDLARMLMAEAALLVDRLAGEEEPAQWSHPPSASDPLEPCVVLNPRPDAKTVESGEEPEVVAPEGGVQMVTYTVDASSSEYLAWRKDVGLRAAPEPGEVTVRKLAPTQAVDLTPSQADAVRTRTPLPSEVTEEAEASDGTVYAKMADGSARLLTPEDLTEKRPTITLCPDCGRVPGVDQSGGCVECGGPVVGVVDDASAGEVAWLFACRAQRDAIQATNRALVAQVEDLERRLERHRAEHLRAFEEGV